jgi:hypothetical protein
VAVQGGYVTQVLVCSLSLFELLSKQASGQSRATGAVAPWLILLLSLHMYGAPQRNLPSYRHIDVLDVSDGTCCF